ncbi:MAG: DUF547 domain-containing protein [Candidatus Obscuribacterales bacterium]|nr:DUF547 domain-containing protein [Candidatus Obscuribacterales bacterium]
MPKIDYINKTRLIFPVFLGLGLILLISAPVFYIPEYLDAAFLKLTYPDSCEFKSYDLLLQKYVKNGFVDYERLKTDPLFSASYSEFERTSPEKLKGTLERLCFWINCFNFLSLKAIADRYPLEQIGQEEALRKFIVGGRLYSLNQIKAELLPELIHSADWRAIFLLCNGSISAPKLSSHAYRAATVGSEFEPALKSFVLSPANYAIDQKARLFSISPFYMWNLRCFDQSFASPFSMVNSFLPKEKQVNLENFSRTYALPYHRHINDLKFCKNLN